MSTVDVVVPCYNYARYLRACVGSVLSQRGVDVRVLVIDDASSDDTPEIGRALAESDARVQFIRHDANRGHIATYNEGLLDRSTGDYAVLLSADDMLAPGSLTRAVRIMDADPRIGMVYGQAVHFTHESQLPAMPPRHSGHVTFSGAEWLERRCRAGYNVITSPEVVVRGSVQRAVGGYRPELPHAGDLEMWLRVAAVSSLAYVRGVPQAFYRVHPESMLRTKYRHRLADLHQRKAAFDAFFDHHQHVPGVGRLREFANRAMAREALWQACRAYDRDEVEKAGASEMVDFAMATYPASSSLSEYRMLRRRQHVGARLCNRTQMFAGAAVAHRVRGWFRKRRLKRRGV
jgi:glycosyltransferase involved in cell wall biosynthesis